MKNLIIFAFASLVIFISGCVQNSDLLESRITALEVANNRNSSQISDLTSHMEKQDSQLQLANDSAQKSMSMVTKRYAAMNYELGQIKEKFLQSQGRLDELDGIGMSGSKKDIDRLDQAISRNYERIVRLEKYMGFEPTAGDISKEEPTSPAPPNALLSQDVQYDSAKILFDQGDFENARIGFENFINKYPDSEKADNARFWIADSYYAEKWYEKAILEYQKVLESYPDSNKSAAARLKQGYAFAQLGEKANARLILNELIKRHPETRESEFAREKLKVLK